MVLVVALACCCGCCCGYGLTWCRVCPSRRCGVAQSANRHHSDAEARIAAVPVIEVDSKTAVCDGGAPRAGWGRCVAVRWCVAADRACSRAGVRAPAAVRGAGGGTTGHPTEWIQLDRREGRIPETCKYCGLRYVMSENAAHGH